MLRWLAASMHAGLAVEYLWKGANKRCQWKDCSPFRDAVRLDVTFLNRDPVFRVAPTNIDDGLSKLYPLNKHSELSVLYVRHYTWRFTHSLDYLYDSL